MTRKEFKRILKLSLIFGTPVFLIAILIGLLLVYFPAIGGLVVIVILGICMALMIGVLVDLLAGEHFLE